MNEVAAALANADPAVRGKALACLGEIVDLERLPLLVQQVVAPKDPADAAVAVKALRAASVRMPDREACAEKLVSALASAPPATKVSLLEILGEVGGTKSLSALSAAAKSDDPALQDASTRLLGNWLTPDAGPALLDLAKTNARPKVGDVVRIIPNHVCVVVNMVDLVITVRGDKIVGELPVAARGKLG